MNKSDLVDSLASSAGMTKADAARVLLTHCSRRPAVSSRVR